MGPILDSLTEHIERRQDEQERRRRSVALSLRGRSVADELDTATAAIERQLLAPLSATEQVTLHRLWLKLVKLSDGSAMT